MKTIHPWGLVARTKDTVDSWTARHPYFTCDLVLGIGETGQTSRESTHGQTERVQDKARCCRGSKTTPGHHVVASSAVELKCGLATRDSKGTGGSDTVGRMVGGEGSGNQAGSRKSGGQLPSMGSPGRICCYPWCCGRCCGRSGPEDGCSGKGSCRGYPRTEQSPSRVGRRACSRCLCKQPRDHW